MPLECKPDGVSTLRVDFEAGLIADRDSKLDNYGVYFYCNDRLVVKELRVREVGYFVSAEAGVPHPDASLCRLIIRLNGPAMLMPWNSSKTGIDYDHAAFLLLRSHIIEWVTYFTKISRATKNTWEGDIFQFNAGTVENVAPRPSDPAGSIPRLRLPPPPRKNKTYAEKIKAVNSGALERQPWTLGLIEGLVAVDIVVRSRLETKNRIALILIDSTVEIAFKEYLVKNLDLLRGDTLKSLLDDRGKAIARIRTKVVIDEELVDRISHYYTARNRLIHERATVEGVTDRDIEIYRQDAWNLLFKLFLIVQA